MILVVAVIVLKLYNIKNKNLKNTFLLRNNYLIMFLK